MQLESGNPEGTENAPAPERPAAFWAWPLILCGVLVVVFGASFLPRAAEIEESEADQSGLAILQLQLRPVIGIAPMELSQALENLAIFQERSSSDREAAALAAVHAFIDPGTEGRGRAGEVIDRRLKQAGASVEFLGQVRTAIHEGVSPAARQKFESALGWFARLLPLEGEPDTFPDAENIHAECFLTAVIIGLSFLAGVLFFFVGLVLLIKGMVNRRQGRLPFAFASEKLPASAWLEGFAIFMGGLAVGSIGGWLIDWKLYPGFGLAGIILAILWPLFRGYSWNQLRQSIGWTRGRGVFREIGAGMAGYLTILPLALAGFALALGLAQVIYLFQGTGLEGEAAAENISHPAVGWMLGGWRAKLSVFLFAAVFAPVFEETLFRGALFRALRGRWSFVYSGLVSGFIFAVIHPQGWMAVPPLMAMGYGFALIREWRDSLIAPVVAHAVNNGILIGVLSAVVS